MSTPNEIGSWFSTWTLVRTYIFILWTKIGQVGILDPPRGDNWHIWRAFHGPLIDMSLDPKTIFFNVFWFKIWKYKSGPMSMSKISFIRCGHAPLNKTAIEKTIFRSFSAADSCGSLVAICGELFVFWWILVLLES